jgi:hypothetical protein
MTIVHVLNHHLSYGFENTCEYFERYLVGISVLVWECTGWNYVMDPVQPTSCTLTLVKDVGSFLGINVDTLTLHPYTYKSA